MNKPLAISHFEASQIFAMAMIANSAGMPDFAVRTDKGVKIEVAMSGTGEVSILKGFSTVEYHDTLDAFIKAYDITTVRA